MVQVKQTRIISEDVTSSVAAEEYSKTELIAARENFWQYRITMNPRLILREKWFRHRRSQAQHGADVFQFALRR